MFLYLEIHIPIFHKGLKNICLLIAYLKVSLPLMVNIIYISSAPNRPFYP